MTAAPALDPLAGHPMRVCANLQIRRHDRPVRRQQRDGSMPEPVHIDDASAQQHGDDQGDCSAAALSVAEQRRQSNGHSRRGRGNAGRGSPGSQPCGSPGRGRQRYHPQIGRAETAVRRRSGRLPISPGRRTESLDAAAPGRHKPPYPGVHTRTCGAIWAYVLGPMPSTSCSSSIRLNRPMLLPPGENGLGSDRPDPRQLF